MRIRLQKATLEDAAAIHALQVASFKSLLEKYQDFDTNPGNEQIEKTLERIRQDSTDFYLILADDQPVGAIRIVLLDQGHRCRISPLFVHPEHQDRGIAQQVFAEVERRYQPVDGWELDTILEEQGNCHLYEKLGYRQTGRTCRIHDRMTLVSYEKR